MKNGIASSTKLSMPRAICCAKITPGSAPSAQMKINAASASAKPIAMPPARLSTNPMSISGAGPGAVRGESVLHASHHQATRHVVGPFDRRVEERAQRHRYDDDQ